MSFHPINAANACIRRSRRLLDLCDGPLTDTRAKNDLRRSALVTAVAGLDAYMHWLVYRRISELRRENDLPKSMSKLDVPFTELAALADATLESRRRQNEIRPWVKVKRVMQKRLLRETFQSYEQVATAFGWAGVEKPWARIAEDLLDKPESIKVRLNALVLEQALVF